MGKSTELSPAAQGHKQSSFRECGGPTSQPCLSPRPCSSLCQLFRIPADTPGSRSLQPQLCDSSSLTATAHSPRPRVGGSFLGPCASSVWATQSQGCAGWKNPSAVPKTGSRVLARFSCPGIHGALIRCGESCLLSVVKPSTKCPCQL